MKTNNFMNKFLVTSTNEFYVSSLVLDAVNSNRDELESFLNDTTNRGKFITIASNLNSGVKLSIYKSYFMGSLSFEVYKSGIRFYFMDDKDIEVTSLNQIVPIDTVIATIEEVIESFSNNL